jgi:C-terminal processing protease CtpA/Prc
MRRLGKYLAASTPQSHARKTLGRILNGPEGSTLVLKVRTRDGTEHRRELPRRAAYYATMRHPRDGDVFKVLPGRIGYVDLDRLTVAQLDAMFERFKETRAIIFDMRGYPNGIFPALAPRLNVKNARSAASFRRRIVDALVWNEQDPPTYRFLQPIAQAAGKSLYQGKTVMLIDERAISQSEHTGLFLESACGTTFIGTPTAGANGDVTVLTVPGGLFVTFSGHDVRHADGRQLQRIGLAPDVRVEPTIRGLRAGRDEVLERALEYLGSSAVN